jgi:hypothetical protein
MIRRTIYTLVAGALLTAGVLVAPTSSSAVPPDGTLLTMPWDTGILYSVDPADAQTTAIGGGDLISATGLTWDPVTQTLFGMDYEVLPASLYDVDPDTGAAVVIGSMGIDEPTGLDAQPGSGILFIAYDDPNGPGSILATVDKATAAVTDVGPTTRGQEIVRLRAIAFDPTDGSLYGASYDQRFWEVDPATGDLTQIPSDPVDAYGLSFDCDGTLYGAELEALTTIDPVGGVVTPIGPMDFAGDFTENLAILCDVEPPATTTTTTTATTVTPATAVPATPVAVAARLTPTFTG